MPDYRVPKDEYVRCEAMITTSKTGRQCRRPAILGVTPVRCERHHEIRERQKGAGCHRRNSGSSDTYNEIYMTRFYTEVLKPTIARRVAAQLQGSAFLEQISVEEELALMRDGASQAVAAYADVVEKHAEKPDENMTQALLVTSAVMRDALKDVVAMAKDTATLHEMRQKLNGAVAAVMSDVVQAIVRAAWEIFEDDHKIGELEKRIREHLEMRQFPVQDGEDLRGTTLTPDMDVTAMDASIPRIEAENAESS